MKTFDDTLRFHLAQEGWYLDKTKIEISNETINGVEIIIGALDSGSLAYFMKGKIYISDVLARYASLPQRRLAILHEYAHAHLNLLGVSSHEKEYACDHWALKELIKSGLYNTHELWDSIALFGEIVDEDESFTHPSSKSRYKRLKSILKEFV